MMVTGYLSDIEALHRAAVSQNADVIARAASENDRVTLLSAYETAAFLDIVAGWITDSGGDPGRPA